MVLFGQPPLRLIGHSRERPFVVCAVHPGAWTDEVLKKEDVLPSTRTLAAAQRAEVQRNLDRIKEMRKQFEKIES